MLHKLSDQNTQPQPNRLRIRTEPKYLRRQLGAVVLAGTLVAGAIQGAETAGSWIANRIQGDPVELPQDTEPHVVQANQGAREIVAEEYGDISGNTETLVSAVQEAGGSDGLQHGEEIQIPDVSQTRALND